MACWLMAPSHYLSQSWLSPIAPSGTRRAHWVNLLWAWNTLKNKAIIMSTDALAPFVTKSFNRYWLCDIILFLSCEVGIRKSVNFPWQGIICTSGPWRNTSLCIWSSNYSLPGEIQVYSEQFNAWRVKWVKYLTRRWCIWTYNSLGFAWLNICHIFHEIYIVTSWWFHESFLPSPTLSQLTQAEENHTVVS